MIRLVGDVSGVEVWVSPEYTQALLTGNNFTTYALPHNMGKQCDYVQCYRSNGPHVPDFYTNSSHSNGMRIMDSGANNVDIRVYRIPNAGDIFFKVFFLDPDATFL